MIAAEWNASRPRHSPSPRAFTMIEIMCVIVIMAIAAAIVFAGLSNQYDLQAESAARQVLADLTYAQNYAIATQQPVYVSFSANTYTLCSALSPVTDLTNPISELSYANTLRTGALPNTTLGTVSFGGTPVAGTVYMCFDELGTPWSCNATGGSLSALSVAGTVPIKAGNKTMTISVQPETGDMTVQ
jgi:prepilin-type N-terminal cleavage/methylation domain-containing protein